MNPFAALERAERREAKPVAEIPATAKKNPKPRRDSRGNPPKGKA